MKFTKSFTIKGEQTQAFDEVRRFLTTCRFKEEGVSWPNHLVAKRGSGGLFNTKIEDCKTLLTISLKQHGDEVFILCEYDVKTPGSFFTGSDRAILEDEVEKLKRDLYGSSVQQNVSQVDVHTESGPRRCEMCGSLLPADVTFCGSCGRAVKPRPIAINIRGEEIMKRGVEVRFEPDRVKTGYDKLDLMLYGGLPKGYAVLLSSPSCEERDLFIARVLETGVKNEQATFYVCSEVSRVAHLVDNYPTLFYVFVCNPQADLIAPNVPNVFKIGDIERLTQLNVALSSAINRLPKVSARPTWIVLNNVSDVLLSCHAQTTRKWLMELIPRLKGQGFTILAILNPYMHAREETQAIVDVFDGHVEMYEKDVAGQSRIHMKVKKMYNQQYSSKEVQL